MGSMSHNRLLLLAVLSVSGSGAPADAGGLKATEPFERWQMVDGGFPWVYQCPSSGSPTKVKIDPAVCDVMLQKITPGTQCTAYAPNKLAGVAQDGMGGRFTVRNCGYLPTPWDKQRSRADALDLCNVNDPPNTATQDLSDAEGKERFAVCKFLVGKCGMLDSQNSPLALRVKDKKLITQQKDYYELGTDFAQGGTVAVSIDYVGQKSPRMWTDSAGIHTDWGDVPH